MINCFPYYAENYIIYEELFSFDGAAYYCAKNQFLDIEYIMKVFPKDQKGMKDRFINEINMLKKLDHPNIIRIYYHFEDDQFFIIVFEKWMHTLGEKIKINSLNRKCLKDFSFLSLSKKKIIIQILNGIQFCHQNGIVHLNLNLSTIVIDKYENVKLIGFDYAFLEKASNQNLLNSLLLDFSAPEIILKLAQKISFATDIWSLGVVFYYFLVEKSPWPKIPNEKEKRATILSGKVNLIQKSDESITFIIHQMIVVNPEMRKSSEYITNFFKGNEPKSISMTTTPIVSPNTYDDCQSCRKSTSKSKNPLISQRYRMNCPYGMTHMFNKQSLI